MKEEKKKGCTQKNDVIRKESKIVIQLYCHVSFMQLEKKKRM